MKKIFVIIFYLFYRSSVFPFEINLAPSDTVLHTGEIEKIQFNSNDLSIAGNLYTPQSKINAYPLVIWVSGSGPSFKEIKNKETIKIVNCFLDMGFAFFRIDKPGCGESEGVINNDSIFARLSDIAVDAVQLLKSHPGIDPKNIGLFGSSQAGYIMPLAASKSKDISFIIGSSCPGENSIDQWNYLLEKQMLCEGIDPLKAAKNIEMFSLLRTTDSKELFDAAINYFDENPLIIPILNYDSSFAEYARSWWPREINYSDESYFNPISIIEKINIPLFMVYGEKDTQIDPVQAIEAYKLAVYKSGNKNFHLAVLKNSDHNMSLSDGCLGTISRLNQEGSYHIDPEYIKTIQNWLPGIKNLKQ